MKSRIVVYSQSNCEINMIEIGLKEAIFYTSLYKETSRY